MLWDDLAAKAGLSRQSLAQIRAGRNMRKITQRRLEDALQWAPGSLAAIDRGGEPTPLSKPAAGHQPRPAPKPGSQEWFEQLHAELGDQQFWELVNDMAEQVRRARAKRDDTSETG
jgi:ribosome-binding protein aMBF1 (putative translation factor)